MHLLYYSIMLFSLVLTSISYIKTVFSRRSQFFLKRSQNRRSLFLRFSWFATIQAFFKGW